MIKLFKGGYTLRQDENNESLLTLINTPHGSIEKVFGIPLCKENVFRIIAETRRTR